MLVSWRADQAFQGSLSCPPPAKQSLNFIRSFLLFQTTWRWRCINYNHNLSQTMLFTLSHGFIRLISRGGGAFQGSLTAPSPHTHTNTHLPGCQKLNYFAYFTYFELWECDDVSIIIIVQLKISYCLGCIVSCVCLQRWGQAVKGS